MQISEKENSTGVAPYIANDDFRKSNFIIGAKYKSTLLANKLMVIALSKVNTGREESSTGLWVVDLQAGMLKKMLGLSSGSFYERLDAVAREITGKSIGMSDPVKKRFEYYAMVVSAIYEGGVLTIKFNPDLKKYIRSIDMNYTIMRLSTLLSFKSTFSFRMYELLKSKCYTYSGEKCYNFRIPFSLAELKLDLGIVDANSESVRKILHGSDLPDYEKAVKVAKEVTFTHWTDLKRRVIDVAVDEINEKTEMFVTYDLDRNGRGGKVVSIIFNVSLDGKDDIKFLEITEDIKTEFLDELPGVLEFQARYSEMITIAEAAGYDMDRVRQAVLAMKNQGVDVRNKVGYIITAIKERYVIDTGKASRNKRVNKFTEIEGHQYDFDDLEESLMEANALVEN